MGGIFRLDLDVMVLKGFERVPLGDNGQLIYAVSDRVIEEVTKSIRAGAEFDPVIVEPDYEEAMGYRLSFVYNKNKGVWEGGHIRAIAHFIEGVPLRCRTKTKEDYELVPIPALKFYPLSQYLILDDSLFAEKGLGLERRMEVWQMNGRQS